VELAHFLPRSQILSRRFSSFAGIISMVDPNPSSSEPPPRGSGEIGHKNATSADGNDEEAGKKQVNPNKRKDSCYLLCLRAPELHSPIVYSNTLSISSLCFSCIHLLSYSHPIAPGIGERTLTAEEAPQLFEQPSRASTCCSHIQVCKLHCLVRWQSTCFGTCSLLKGVVWSVLE
jgi:hypothetical protein